MFFRDISLSKRIKVHFRMLIKLSKTGPWHAMKTFAGCKRYRVSDGNSRILCKTVITIQSAYHTIKYFHQTKEGRQLRQFVFLMWRDGTSVPSDKNTMMDLLNAVQRWQPVTEEAHPMLVICE